ncbi:hypothetical protein SEA_VIBAKI_56 [Arthrobacter phage Vibaki]|uniref:Uncharacterized protein n=1 Tax=Arthrobacter phage Vibaki TaxID=2593333 RepID=A0A514TZ14_9CAUD|nr:hypothetical protein HYP95_gp56 [Arthrobacter phage Vibaki]QDK01936.1 hypothetical protein SEA_VIBAKI_56 [Arthrobacter phage Vibaki]
MGGGPSWRLDHNPNARPLGCNGRYGKSGAERHRRAGRPACKLCKASAAHWARENRRGGLRPRTLQPCGTPAAAHRHRQRGEPVDFACHLAEATYRAELRTRTTERQAA